MKMVVLLAVACSFPAYAADPETLCAGNPAFTPRVMLSIVQAQLQRDHDPALDAATPEKLADQAVAQGVAECAADMRADPTIAPSLAGLAAADLQVGWDAYNSACADRKSARGACITAEVGAARALKRMMATNAPAGSKTLVQTCALVLQPDPAMAEWRECVDQALAVHAAEDVAKSCKVSVTWHIAKTGADAGRAVAGCLSARHKS